MGIAGLGIHAMFEKMSMWVQLEELLLRIMHVAYNLSAQAFWASFRVTYLALWHRVRSEAIGWMLPGFPENELLDAFLH